MRGVCEGGQREDEVANVLKEGWLNLFALCGIEMQ